MDVHLDKNKHQREARRCRCAPGMITDQLCVPGPGSSHSGPYCPISQREIAVPVLWTLKGILRTTGTLQNCSGRTERSADAQCLINSLIIQHAFLVRGSWIQSLQKMCTWPRQSGSGMSGHLDTAQGFGRKDRAGQLDFRMRVNQICVSLLGGM